MPLSRAIVGGMEAKAIAGIKLEAVEEDGARYPIEIALLAPVEEPDGTWACEVELSGLDAGLKRIYGGDSFQALCLAIQYVKTALEEQAKGSRLVYPGDGEDVDWPIEAYLHFH